jgi:uncharacterized protein YegP (UPF0339 family)
VINRVEFYKDSADEWRWRFVAAENGNSLADSGEGYAEYGDAESAMLRVVSAMQAVATGTEFSAVVTDA